MIAFLMFPAVLCFGPLAVALGVFLHTSDLETAALAGVLSFLANCFTLALVVSAFGERK